MRDILQARLARLAEVEQAMADPDLVHDQVRYRQLTSEHKELSGLQRASAPYRKLVEDLESARAVVREGGDDELVEMAREEVAELEERLPALEDELRLLLLPRDPDDSRDALLEIRAGTGGDEAALFAQDLARMYQRFAERRGWRLEMLDMSEGTAGGLKEAIFSLKGDGAYGELRWESGVHRVQRVPATESQGRIHTSACSVVVMPEAEEVEVEVDPGDLRIDVYRSSGAGGQHVNTTDSAVRITHEPTGIVVTCQDERSQHKNKAKAMKMLSTRLYDRARQEQEAAEAAERRGIVAGGDRSAKIRTYNFPQSRITDHRIGYTAHNLSDVLDGDLDELSQALVTHYREQQLAAQGRGR